MCDRIKRPDTRLHPTITPNRQINPCKAGAIHTGHSDSFCGHPRSNASSFDQHPYHGSAALSHSVRVISSSSFWLAFSITALLRCANIIENSLSDRHTSRADNVIKVSEQAAVAA
jgi:hypothetical protein